MLKNMLLSQRLPYPKDPTYLTAKMIGDVQSLLRGGEKTDKESPLISGMKILNKKTVKPSTSSSKRPEGMARELYNLISNKDLSAVMPTDMRKTYQNPKFKMGFRAVRKYKWVPFTNEGRSDGLQLYHWQRVDKINQNEPYPFAKLNKVIDIPTYTDEVYEEYLKCKSWSREETDYLFEVCRQFDIRWPIVLDRYDMKKFGVTRSMEDLKDRFYSILYELALIQDPNSTPVAYDADHEKRRKEQLCKQWDRTKEQLKEEEELMAEMRRIEQRKKERERKAHDLQKLINMSEQPASPSTMGNSSANAMAKKKSAFRIKTGSVSSSSHAVFNPLDISVTALRFSEFKSSGAHLRSQEMKLPTNIGQKKLKNIEIVLEKSNMEMNPFGHEDIMKIYNDFRSQIMLLQELKSALQTAEFELESLRSRMQENGKDFEIEPKMRVSNLVEGGLDISMIGSEGCPQTIRRITSYIDVNQKDIVSMASRKRKIPSAVLTPVPSDMKRRRF
ncbi:unnamed protein product [Caenorhabditis bovis]|uniref:DNA methyltransferase 1-associated protein 1 n=1 Tax=Caenorhabditis bovis TaxID=2654633 RepID=A0A8S1F8M4_9PELO|nr:unnamed protein product [Caenorhabditis bovis]